ncbi:MAG: universal stress protein [Flavobacteriales bacterium]|nr:universal stress protein [Flavobacteriales bacterium]
MATILLPTDFSDTALNAAKFAIELYGTEGNKFVLVHSFLKPSYDNVLLPGLGDIPQREAINRTRRVERILRKFAKNVSLGRKVSSIGLVKLLNDLDKRKGVEMVVMGTQGEGNFGLVGRNARSVVSDSTAPVITVPAQWSSQPVERIMLAYDGKELDRYTLKPLLDLAGRRNAEVVITHVRYTVPGLEVLPEREKVEGLFTGVKDSYLTVQGNDVIATIDELATNGRIQLVAVIHRQMGFWKGLFHASTAKRMALHTSLPMLVLPERPR